MTDSVPPSLVGREVSVRAVIPVWEGVRALGLDPARLADGTGCTIEQLTSARERISWDAFARVMTNLGELLDDAAIIRLGTTALQSPFLKALQLPARWLFGIDEVFRWAFGPGGPPQQLIAVNIGQVVRVGPKHLRLEVRPKPGYAPSRENFLLLHGTLLALARIGRQEATVEHTLRDDGATFDIHVAASTSLVDRVKAYLRRAPDRDAELTARYAELEREVAARMAKEAELSHLEQRYRDLFERAPLPMFVFETATRCFLTVNRAAVQTYGYSAEEFVGMSIDTIRPPEDVPALREAAAAGIAESRVWRHRKKDGTIMHVQVSLRDIVFAGKAARLVHVFDMTARLALEEQLRHAQRIEAIGRLAGGVAHDFNNLLMVVSSYTDLLLRRDRGGPMQNELEVIRSAAARGSELTQRLLMFARRSAIEPRVLDLGGIVESMRVLLRPMIGHDHELVLDIAARRGSVRADRSGLEQIIMNLVVNARDAMPDAGTITVAVHDLDIDAAMAERHVGIKPGPHVALVVTDTGTGMDEPTRARVFEPFFTTKPVDKGTGLGLSIVLGIVEQNGGHVFVDSTPGAGTTFTVWFPRTAPVSDVASEHRNATILVVEDDQAIRSATCNVLTSSGYTVLEASDAASAVAICETDAAIDLVVSDVVLPRATGVELAKTLRVGRPNLKVLWMSGYANMLPTDAATAYLTKPFTAESLVEQVRSLLA